MRRGLRPALIAMALLLGTAAAPSPVTVDAEGLRKLAHVAVQGGFANDALGYTDALLQRDPEDATALVIRSQALRALGRLPEAQEAARAAWSAAKGDPGRYGAAMAMAQALSTQGRRTSAQWWLRRAAQNAPNPRAAAVARRDFAYVKSRNPWDVQINATAAPSSNVNNGSTQDRLTLAGLPFEFEIPPGSQALSGFRLGLGVRGTYRFSPTGPNRQTRATFGLLGQSVALSGEAKDKAPERRGSEFSYAAVEAGLHHQRAVDAEGRTIFSAGATIGHNWYGGDALSRYAQVDLGLDRKLSARDRLSFGIAGDRVQRIDSPVQSSDRVELSLGYLRLVGEGDLLTLRVTGARATSDSPEVGNEAMGVSLDWAKAEPVAGVAVSAGIGAERKLFEQSRYVAGGREDLRLTANVTLNFTRFDYMGFSPVLDLRMTRNRSNAALYDTRDTGLTLGIKSSF